MAVEITIQNKIISFPSSGNDPNWAPALVEFAEAVAEAIATVTGGYDVAPQTQTIDSFNPGVSISLDSLIFPPLSVRSVTVFYAVHRETSLTQAVEGGNIVLVYNSSNPVNSKWELARYKVGDAQISFAITDAGQMKFTTTALSGINHTGNVTFRAVAVLNSST